MSGLRMLLGLFLLTLTVSAALIAWDLHRSLLGIRSGIEHVAASAASVQQIVGEERAAQKQQTEEFTKAISNVHDLLIHADLSLNGSKKVRGVLPMMADLLAHTDDQLNKTSLPAITAAAQQSMKAIGDNADAIGDSAEAFTALVNDPHTASILANLDSSTGHFNVIAGNSAAMSSDMRLAVHRLAQPPSKFHQFLDASWTAAKFGSLFIP